MISIKEIKNKIINFVYRYIIIIKYFFLYYFFDHLAYFIPFFYQQM
jgi:hypothetical protein